jgi:hypothetical protein
MFTTLFVGGASQVCQVVKANCVAQRQQAPAWMASDSQDGPLAGMP